MHKSDSIPLLNYHTVARGTELRLRWRYAGIGFFPGVLILIALLATVSLGGPIFPMTVCFSPVWIFVELELPVRIPIWAASVLHFVGSPTLYGIYAALAAPPAKKWMLVMAGLIHVISFLIVCTLRDVWRLL
jgi:hypothetical protein